MNFTKAKVLLITLMMGLVGAVSAWAHASDDLSERLARVPKPWVQPVHHLTLDEYERTLQSWADNYPGLATLEKRGESVDGMPLYLLKITDASDADTDKQVVMISALHGGPERSGSTTILRLAQWLLGSSDEARVTRRKQVILLMPILNPDAFFTTDRFGNRNGIDVYDPPQKWWNLDTLTLVEPKKMPEVASFLAVMDEYQPEMHLDLHGTGLQGFKSEEIPADRQRLQGMTMFEVSANSYSNCGVRPWDPRVTEAMVQAGIAAGYGSDRTEGDAQRIFWQPDLDAMKDRLWIPPRPDRFRTMFYSYMKYHTMISTTEIGWEESGVARVRGILALGNKPWVTETVSGYPVDRVKARAGRYITAYGKTAAERRESRVELWRAQGKFVDDVIYPEYAGRTSYVVAVTPRGVAALDADKEKFVAKLRELPGVNADGVESYLKVGPELRLSGDHHSLGDSPRIQNGIGFRMRIPYRNPELLDVSVNGHSLSESATEGYESWYAEGYTHVQVNLPPSKTRESDLYVVTCAYDPKETRTYGFEPPAAVLTGKGSAKSGQSNELTSLNNDHLKKWFEKFPEADGNHDEILTSQEAWRYQGGLAERNRDAAAKARLARAAAAKAGHPESGRMEPNFANVRYGSHDRNVLDLWLAKSDQPTPLVIYYHGGGFRGGDKRDINDSMVRVFLDAGVSVASANYRYTTTAPLPAAYLDSGRALQFIRSKAMEWNLDSTRVAAYGPSAGGAISLWLGFHDDLAEPESSDLVTRQSTRLVAVGSIAGQCIQDPNWVRSHIGEAAYLSSSFKWKYGVRTQAELSDPKLQTRYDEMSAITYLDPSDPPVFEYYTEPDTPLPADAKVGQGIHHPIFGHHLKSAMDAVGVECVYRHVADMTGDPKLELAKFLTGKLGVVEDGP